MGIAAYNRGTQVVRHQTDTQLAEVSPAIEHRAERSRIRELEQQLRLATETALNDRNRALAVIRSLRVKLDDSRQQCKFWKDTARRAMASITAIRQSWHRASELLRMLPASKVQELRDLRDMHQTT